MIMAWTSGLVGPLASQREAFLESSRHPRRGGGGVDEAGGRLRRPATPPPPLREVQVRTGSSSGLTLDLSLKGQATPLLYTGLAGRFVV
jgi:hypothetical protein